MTLIPVTIGAGCCGSMDGIGQGFVTYEFDEVKEMALSKEDDKFEGEPEKEKWSMIEVKFNSLMI